MRAISAHILIAFLAIAAGGAGSAQAVIVGEVIIVGFPAARGLGAGADLIRRGEWTPVLVRLTLENDDSFTGSLRVSQPDKDGDLAYDIQPLHLRRDQSRVYWLYAVAGLPTGRASSFTVDVLSEENEPIELVCRGEQTYALTPAQAPEGLTANDYLVLSVGDAVGSVALIDSSAKFMRSVRVAHVAPDWLPTRWQGLAAVDAIVWDRADPTELSDPQLEALTEWTLRGGRLVLAAGTNADRVANKLGHLLPVEVGPTISTAALPGFRSVMLTIRQEGSNWYRSPIVVARCTPKKGVRIVYEERGEQFKSLIAAERRAGRGQVVFVAAALGDLIVEEAQVDDFFRRLLHLREEPGPRVYEPKSLMAEIEGWVGFQQAGATYLAVAILFAFAYVMVATFGTWHFLRMRGWLRHSWSAFALVGVVTSLVSVMGVQAVRGVGWDLAQVSVVDLVAGQSRGSATAYFGLKTGMFGMLDAWLPSDYPNVVEPHPTACVIQAMPPSRAGLSTKTYADPGRYRVVPSQAELLGVPIRGTVKQFQGRWVGTLSGGLKADLRTIPGSEGGTYDVRIGDGGTIVNELGVDFDKTFIVYAARDAFVPNTTLRVPDWSDKIYVFPLGPLAQGESVQPASRLYYYRDGQAKKFEDWSGSTLKKGIEDWSKGATGFSIRDLAGGSSPWGELERHEMSLLLLSFFQEYTPPLDANPWAMTESSLTCGTGCHLDIAPLLDADTALFIGFAREEGPVTLCARNTGAESYRRVSPRDALTMYRVLIPLQ
jgi:hypothetical protein